MKKKNLAFTLAEVLIVIGIIGVVAALTLPNLNHATGDKEKVTKVKKIYSTLTEAFDRAQVVYGNFDTWFTGLNHYTEDESERFAKRLTEFMKVSKDCKFEEGCFSSAPFKYYYGEEGDSYLESLQSRTHYYMVMLPDNVSVAFGLNGIYRIKVDIDGPNKGKNQEGSDLFDFCINTKDDVNFNVYPDSLYSDLYIAGCIDNNNCNGYVTAWVIENGNLDYLKTDEDGNCPDGQPLNWETKTSCE